jgi:hypothetical protein
MVPNKGLLQKTSFKYLASKSNARCSSLKSSQNASAALVNRENPSIKRLVFQKSTDPPESYERRL